MKSLSKETRERFVLLNSLLANWKKEKITSVEIAKAIGCKADLVRWDIRFLNIEKGVSNGYKTESLQKAVKSALSLGDDFTAKNGNSCLKKRVCVVGLGRLGAALLDDGIFLESGFEVLAGFDSSVNRVEMLRSTFELFPANRIESVCKQKGIEYAILCCAESEVERMVSRLITAEIKGIVNYTKSIFAVPREIKVINAAPSVMLEMLLK